MRSRKPRLWERQLTHEITTATAMLVGHAQVTAGLPRHCRTMCQLRQSKSATMPFQHSPAMSLRAIILRSGYWILMATSWPSCVTPLCTCASEAAASGCVSISRNTRSGLHPNSSSKTRDTSAHDLHEAQVIMLTMS